MHRALRGVALAVSGFALASCESGSAFSPISARMQLDRARDRWIAVAPTNYAFTVRRLCECMGPGPLRVTVEDGAVVSVRPVGGGDEVAGAGQGMLGSLLGLFDLVTEEIDRHPYWMRAKYDPALGHLVEVTVDYYAHYADDEWTLVISDVIIAQD